MPRIKGLTNEQKVDYQRVLLAERLDFALYKSKISKSMLAYYIGITPQAVCKQFAKKRISTEVIIAVVTLTNLEPEEVKRMLTIGN